MRRTAVLVLAASLAACAAPAPAGLDPARAQAIEAGVRSLTDAIARDLSQEGPDAWLRHFVDDGTFFMANDGQLAFPDLAAATSAVNAFDPTITRMGIAWEDLRIVPLSDSVAAVATPYSEVLIDTAGEEVRLGGYVTMLAVETAEGWRLQHLHWSSVPPSPGGGEGGRPNETERR